MTNILRVWKWDTQIEHTILMNQNYIIWTTTLKTASLHTAHHCQLHLVTQVGLQSLDSQTQTIDVQTAAEDKIE